MKTPETLQSLDSLSQNSSYLKQAESPIVKRLMAIGVVLSLASGSVITIPAAPANAWLFGIFLRAAVINEVRTIRATCKSNPQTCRSTIKRLTSKSRLKAVSSKSKRQSHRS
jgi:hypothetical protein